MPRDYPFIQQMLTEDLFCARHIMNPNPHPRVACGVSDGNRSSTATTWQRKGMEKAQGGGSHCRQEVKIRRKIIPG